MQNSGSIVQAKEEFTRQLEDVVVPVTIDRLFKLYNSILADEERAGSVEDVFTQTLQEVDDWSDAKISDLASEVQSRCGCVEDMIAAIFVATIRICTVVRAKRGSDQNKIKIKLPPWKLVIHNIFRRACLKVRKNRGLFSEVGDDSELYDRLESMFQGICAREISRMLPISDIVNYVASSGGTSQAGMIDDQGNGFDTDEEVDENDNEEEEEGMEEGQEEEGQEEGMEEGEDQGDQGGQGGQGGEGSGGEDEYKTIGPVENPPAAAPQPREFINAAAPR